MDRYQPAAHHALRVADAIVSGAAAKSAIVGSWRRSSLLHRLDPAEQALPQRLTSSETVADLRQFRRPTDAFGVTRTGRGCMLPLMARETALMGAEQR
jgi:hypothetical protein